MASKAQQEVDTLETGVANLTAADIEYTPSGGLSGTDVQSAIDELESEKAAGIIASGTYTPTRSDETNLDANVTPTQAQYLRVGSVVTVSGGFKADPTTTVTATRFDLTLPIASNLGAVEDLAGVAFCGVIAGQGAEIRGVPASDKARVMWIAGDVTSQDWSYTFTYRII